MPNGSPHPPIRVFLSYADADHDALKALNGHLSPLRRDERIICWDRSMIPPGAATSAEREHELRQAQIIIVLLSSHYLADDDCYQELEQARSVATVKGCHLVPVLWRPVELTSSLAALQLLPRNQQSIAAAPNPDEAWTGVASEIRQLVDGLQSAAPSETHARETIPEPARLLDGITELPGGEALYIQGFLGRYLGTAERPALFCGREQAVAIVLHLLAGALGPLTQADLLDLAREELPGSFTLDDAIEPLGRFLIGDGRQSGLSFTHSGLGTYFWDKMSQREREAMEARFLTRGNDTVAQLEAGKLNPAQVSRYVVQHHRAHLERAGAGTARWMKLVSDGWRRAWWAVEGSYTGFLADVKATWSQVQKEDEQQGQRGARLTCRASRW